MGSELDFHKEMIDIFTSVRDLNTNYLLPTPFAGHFAFLPFKVDSFMENENEDRYQFLFTLMYSVELCNSLLISSP
jgi:hypothetical protein